MFCRTDKPVPAYALVQNGLPILGSPFCLSTSQMNPLRHSQYLSYKVKGTRMVSRIANWFIDFFGITHPSEKQRRLAGLFIVGLLLGTIAALVGVFALLFSLIRL
ncbi:hypothetical protein [Terriglobus tenax]|uniref:hypothetical protein n=1 Tax=Terriglobus tenax TaxID=1111115 RepID=UPI0021E00E90|nr:hypothetical protein [Terriglobus tenax]